MKLKTLDLRDKHCPMSLLLVKRNVGLLSKGECLSILIQDEASFRDIRQYLELHFSTMSHCSLPDGFQIDIEKES